MCVAGSALALGWRGCSRFLCVCGELDGGGGGGLAGWPFPGWGGACWLCAKSRALRVRASPSEVYPTGKLQ